MAEEFSKLFVSKEVQKALSEMGIVKPTSVQEKTIPLMMDGHDIIAIAPTGTGKTIAFGIPMLEYIDLKSDDMQELVLAPTRELAMQIYEEILSLAKYIKGVRIALIYGGQPIKKQAGKLKKKPHIVIATPGRLLDMIYRRFISISRIHTMVIDEADEMFNMGFIEDVKKILDMTPADKQTVMFSATTNQDVMTVSWQYQYKPVEIVVQAKNEDKPKIKQYVIKAEHNKKTDYVLYLFDSNEYKRAMVFVNTKFMAEKLCVMLQKNGYDAKALHGDIRQKQRTLIMNGFKQGEFSILVCTDVAARGIDVYDVDIVINYDLPNENEYYLHRIGRTGRAKKEGEAFTLLTFQESVRMDEIIRYMGVSPDKLYFDQYGILLKEDGEAFFKNI
ncbi:MAG: DEAD/DEAH box helicase [Eubacteriales bacterium]|nr:DEAD/DEAH box helicase [Eubacteriales bacterium]